MALPDFRDGDVFYWSWKDNLRSGHCCSWKAIFRNGFIEDIFWHGGDNKRWTPEKAMQEIDLEFKGNIEDLAPINSWEIAYYHELDVTDLRHSNSGQAKVYKRVGAKRDAMKMAELARSSGADYKRHAQYLLERSAECEKIANDLAGGVDAENIYIPTRLT